MSGADLWFGLIVFLWALLAAVLFALFGPDLPASLVGLRMDPGTRPTKPEGAIKPPPPPREATGRLWIDGVEVNVVSIEGKVETGSWPRTEG